MRFFLIMFLAILGLRSFQIRGYSMSIPHIKGVVAKQAHVGVPDGTFEEEVARNGFSGRYAHLYRTHPPVAWKRIEGPLKPHAFDLRKIHAPSEANNFRKVFLSNDDVAISFARMTKAMEFFYRNADGDEVLFVHAGEGRLETDFGPLQYTKGDYLIIPRGTVYRLAPSQESSFLVIESFSEVNFPDRGMLGQHALFDPAVIKVPTPENLSTMSTRPEYELRIKHRGEFTKVFYEFCPLDTVGWKGTLSVQQLNVADIRPVLSDRYHLPPSAHCTFVANNFVICTFLPRPLENGDEKAMKVPFYHSNIDFDEVIFYHEGEFFSRAGIDEGMVTFHPQGIHHGPQKKAIEKSVDKKRTNEIAVMIDTKRPLDTHDVYEIEVKDYWKSWQN